MAFIKLNPQSERRLFRFKSIKRGYYSFIIMGLLIFASLFAELFINSRALVVSYKGELTFPTYGKFYSGKDFGFDYEHEVDYRSLKKRLSTEGNGDWVLLPIVPWNEFENDLNEEDYPPVAPDLKKGHYLGTDSSGRDVFARIIYGFRYAIFFSLILLVCNYTIGIVIGCLMGYFGGRFDLFVQRIIEVWSNVPFLYIVIIISSIMVPNFKVLIGIMVFFGWMSMTWYMRTSTYKEKAREYVMAARALGASPFRVVFHHILPNSISIVITFIPFAVAGGISSLTSLDYLGFGLPAPTPSWGELLKQGTDNMDAWWIASSVIFSMVMILVMVTFIGEAIREAFDPKKFTTYE